MFDSSLYPTLCVGYKIQADFGPGDTFSILIESLINAEIETYEYLETKTFNHLSTMRVANSRIILASKSVKGYYIMIHQTDKEANAKVVVEKKHNPELYQAYINNSQKSTFFFLLVGALILLIALLEASMSVKSYLERMNGNRRPPILAAYKSDDPFASFDDSFGKFGQP